MAWDKRKKRKRQAQRLQEVEPKGLPRGVVIMMLLTLIGLAMYAVYRAVPDDSLPVRQVRVMGEFKNLSQAAVQESISPFTNRDFFSVDLEAIEAAVRANPWVYEVSVRRVWPDAIEIRIVEQEVAARWGDEALLNPYGDVFRPSMQKLPAGLPKIHGPETKRHELIDQFLAAYNKLGDIGLVLNGLIEDRRGSWVLELNNGMSLALGQREQEQRIERFVTAYPGLIAPKQDQVERIDLRYSNGLAIAWMPEPNGPDGRVKGE
ncbi:MAG: FtsQ-type POTRA domain-containing protein [Gammaproteobacteria bacterium]|nr:FtsQ-type POTRA domain-containing protein [Gammaproteobacteria bacterium]